MSNKTVIQIDDLRALYRNNPTAKALLDLFANRQNNSATTKTDRMHAAVKSSGHDCSQNEVVKVLKALGRLGAGRYVVGRKGHPSRMNWQVGLVSLGQAAAGNRADVEPAGNGSEAGGEPDESTSEQAKPQAGQGLMQLTFPLRRLEDGRVISAEFSVPKDFNQKDAERLVAFIQALPFSGEE